eukprot:9486299-Pyramimonas_sp.AAC.1
MLSSWVPHCSVSADHLGPTWRLSWNVLLGLASSCRVLSGRPGPSWRDGLAGVMAALGLEGIAA